MNKSETNGARLLPGHIALIRIIAKQAAREYMAGKPIHGHSNTDGLNRPNKTPY